MRDFCPGELVSYRDDLVIDLSAEQTDPPAPKIIDGKPSYGVRISHGRTVRRPPGSVRGITVHQTACVFGTGKATHNLETVKHRRALRVHAHMTVFNTGKAVLAYPLDWYVYHGNGLNGPSYGLEIEGMYPGLISQPKATTWGGKPTELGADQLEAARAGLAYLVERGRADGNPVEYIWAHRQSSGTRRSDPGEEIWRRLVLEFAVPVLGLRTEPVMTMKTGRPIPVEWDPSGKGKY